MIYALDRMTDFQQQLAIAAVLMAIAFVVGAAPALAVDQLARTDASFCRSGDSSATPRRSGVRLQVSSRRLRPGETLAFRIENSGPDRIALLSEAFVVERYFGRSWIRAAGSPTSFPRRRPGFVSPGDVGFCRSFDVPEDTPPGLYRVRKDVRVIADGRATTARSIAKFGIQP